jgi:septal ring factor EnvC (AmiA/AmiB activator)
MKRFLALLLTLCLVVPLSAQKKQSVQKKATTTRTVSKRTTKKAPAKQQTRKQAPVTVQGLKNQRQQLQKQMKEQERRLRQTEKDVKARLQNLMVINTEIDDKRKVIDTIRRDITTLDGNMHILDDQLKVFEKELNERKQRYMNSVRYMHRNRGVHQRLMFIFSADNFTQMYRRMRFVREYAVYQRAQGEAVKSMQKMVSESLKELTDAKRQKDDLLYRDEQEKKALEDKQVEQQKVVNTLQKQQKTIQSILDQQRKKDADLNAQIDKLIAEEIARAKARAEAERKKKAAEEARKKREEELARKKAAADDERAHRQEMAAVKKKAETETNDWTVSSEDRRLSSNFESNRGRFPMPITGPYKIVNTFGQSRVEGLKGTTMQDIKGINIKGQTGAKARCIFDGVVSGVGGYGGSMIVIVRHGNYLSVYCNLASVSVTRGQKVSARQALGTVGNEGVMQFQLRRLNGSLLNPSSWLGR